MKTKRWIIAGLFAIMLLTFVGCPNSSQPELPVVRDTLTDRIKDASVSIDFGNVRIAEDAVVDSAITIKNLKMGGKTLTINAPGVELNSVSEAVIIIGANVGDGDVTLKNCKDITKLEINGGGENSIHLSRSKVESVEIKKDKVRVVLKNTEITKQLTVIANKTKLEVKDETTSGTTTVSKVTTLEIASTVDYINLAGGQITKIVVKTDDSTETPNTPAVNITENVTIAEVTGTTTLNIAEEILDSFVKPTGITSVEEIKVSKVELINTTAKTEYITLERFDYSGLYAKLIYEGGATKNLPLTSENCSISGFDSSEAGNVTVKVTYDGKLIGSFTVTIKLVVTGTKLVTENAKVEYIKGDSFDYSGLFAEISYSDNTSEKIALTNKNCTISGFDSSTAGSNIVKVTYVGELIGSFTVNVSENQQAAIDKKAEAKGYIDEAIEELHHPKGSLPDFDGVVALFKKAYDTYKTDETKLYYALAELASISTDESVAKLLKENYGFKNYPQTMNALISGGEWTKEYLSTSRHYYTPYSFTKNESGGYLRVTGELLSNGIYVSGTFGNDYYADVSYIHDEGDEWIPSYINAQKTAAENFNVSDFDNLDDLGGPFVRIFFASSNNTPFIKNPVPSETGEYMISYLSYYSSNYDDSSDYSNFRYTSTPKNQKYITVINGRQKNPEFLIPAGIDMDTYNSTLYKTLQTSNTISYLMLMNILSCNANGFNNQIDNILDVFGTKYNNAKKVASEISQASIELPSDITEALNLSQIFGSSSVKIGKAEVDVLFAATDIVKGLFQWLSSYDLSMDVKDTLWDVWDTEPGIEVAAMLSNTNTLGLRSATAMKESKATILGALNTIMASYKYVTETSETYPSAIKDMIKNYGDPVYDMVEDFATSVRAGTQFELDFGEGAVSVDLGKFFEPGYLSDIYEKDSAGNIKTTVYGYYSQGRNVELRNKLVLDYTKDIETQIYAAIKAELNWDNIASNTLNIRQVQIGWELDTDIVKDLVSILRRGNGQTYDYIDMFLYGLQSGNMLPPMIVNLSYSK